MRTRRNGVKYFMEEEKEKFLKAVEESRSVRDKMIVSLFLATGIRLSELANLFVSKVQDKKILKVVGKGRKEREIPLKTKTQEELRAFLEWKKGAGESLHPNAPLFCSPLTKKRLSNRAIQFRIDYYVRKADLERDFSPHALRHTFGYGLGKKGIPLQVIQKLLGHSNINTTQIYCQPDLDQMRLAVESL